MSTFKIKQRIKPKVVVANSSELPYRKTSKCQMLCVRDSRRHPQFLEPRKGMDSRGIRIRLAEHSSTLCKQWFDLKRNGKPSKKQLTKTSGIRVDIWR